MSTAAINKIHVTNSTGLSLNDRFTAIASVQPEPIVKRRRSPSRGSSPSDLAPVDRATSVANRRLLQQLARRHKLQAALKLKRRSMRTIGNGPPILKRGSIKALRVSANGRPIRANSLTKIATMKADYIPNNGSNRIRRPLRRSNSTSSIAERLGARRPSVGGAPQRVAQRRLMRSRGGGGGSFGNRQSYNQSAAGSLSAARRGRSRSRSFGRDPARTRSLSRGRIATNNNNRSYNNYRNNNYNNYNNNYNNNNINRGNSINRRGGRSRSRSRTRGGGAGANGAVSIKARLGVRPGSVGRRGSATGGGISQPMAGARRGGRGGRGVNIGRRGVAAGRIQKRRGSMVGQQQQVGNIRRGGGTAGNARMSRASGRPATRNSSAMRGRSRSNTRKGSVGQQWQQQQRTSVGRRGGRSQQRLPRGGGGATQRNGNLNNHNRGQQQPRRGRSRSRGRGGAGRGGGRNLGLNIKPEVVRDKLDKELDQYMATTRTENDMDYLLK